jgi:hypothetical protein
MPYRYTDFYKARPPVRERAVRAAYATLAGNLEPARLLSMVSQLSEPVVMAYLGPDDEIHVIHRIQEHLASLEHPAPRYEGKFIGLLDEVGDFGASLGVIDHMFFLELAQSDVPSAAAITAALATAGPGNQLTVAPDDAALQVTVRFGVMVPPPFVAELLFSLAKGPVRPRAFWTIAARIAADPPVMAACSSFVDWCRVAVAMGAGEANPLRGIDGAPAPVAVDDALGKARMVVRDLDFPPTAAPAPVAAPILPAAALQPIVDAMMALGNASRERDAEKEDLRYAEAQEKVAPATIWESGIASLYRMCQAQDDTGLPPFWARLAKTGLKHCSQRAQWPLRPAIRRDRVPFMDGPRGWKEVADIAAADGLVPAPYGTGRLPPVAANPTGRGACPPTGNPPVDWCHGRLGPHLPQRLDQGTPAVRRTHVGN